MADCAAVDVEGVVSALRSISIGLGEAFSLIALIDLDVWQGEAADSLAETVSSKRDILRRASMAFDEAANNLSRYAGAVRDGAGESLVGPTVAVLRECAGDAA